MLLSVSGGACCRAVVRRGAALAPPLALRPLSTLAGVAKVAVLARARPAVAIGARAMSAMQGSNNTNTPQPAGGSEEANETNFQQVVAQASMSKPVIVFCLAEWSQQCKDFAPVLAREVGALGSAFKLVHLDAEKSPRIAQALQVAKVPHVLVVWKGQLADSFTGALAAADLTTWLQRLATKLGIATTPPPNSIEGVMKHANTLLVHKRFSEASEVFMAVAQRAEWEAKRGAAKAGLVLCYLGLGQREEAVSLAANIRESHTDSLEDPLVKRALALVDLQPPKGMTQTKAEEAVAANPNDMGARLELAKVLLAADKPNEAIEAAFFVVRKDMQFGDGAAKQLLFRLFDALGDVHDDLVRKSRRRLSNYVFQ